MASRPLPDNCANGEAGSGGRGAAIFLPAGKACWRAYSGERPKDSRIRCFGRSSGGVCEVHSAAVSVYRKLPGSLSAACSFTRSVCPEACRVSRNARWESEPRLQAVPGTRRSRGNDALWPGCCPETMYAAGNDPSGRPLATSAFSELRLPVLSGLRLRNNTVWQQSAGCCECQPEKACQSWSGACQ